ncbi:transcriptional regulator SlyA [Rhodoferax lithotrophicus]|uniref:Transcriptional regulator SlyA n=1 Tax=Rhodoferax lithotrophicus TaxID=2798804 RepID=A0ABN6D6Y6_9BURK|nr:MarR family transcriptional regulator [Rhodoferax sp. MIZ03]BCO26629.1 transcriptional regulator SlyA [Rhodoferax sp. MIZ03]
MKPNNSSPLPSDSPCFYTAQNYQPAQSVGYMMRRIVNHIAREVEREMEPLGLTNAQWVPLLKLHLGCGSTVAELARESELDAGSMTRLLDRLETKQLCQRVRSVDDRRVVHIELTPAGTAAAEQIPAVLSRVQNTYLAGFSVEEWRTLQSLLGRILHTAQLLREPKDLHDN